MLAAESRTTIELVDTEGKGWPVNNVGILIDVLVRFFTPKVFHSIAQGRRAAAHPG